MEAFLLWKRYTAHLKDSHENQCNFPENTKQRQVRWRQQISSRRQSPTGVRTRLQRHSSSISYNNKGWWWQWPKTQWPLTLFRWWQGQKGPLQQRSHIVGLHRCCPRSCCSRRSTCCYGYSVRWCIWNRLTNSCLKTQIIPWLMQRDKVWLFKRCVQKEKISSLWAVSPAVLQCQRS